MGIRPPHLLPVDFPYRTARTEPVITQQQRLEHIRRILDPDTDLTADERAAALLLLLYGQPLTRIAGMHLRQLNIAGQSVTILITEDRLTIPAPFDTVFRQHAASIPHQTTSVHTDNEWLFPGRRPGQHLHQNSLMGKLRRAGIDLRGARNAALRALVLELPAPVIADALGYSYQVTDKHRRNAGATFNDYVARRPAPLA